MKSPEVLFVAWQEPVSRKILPIARLLKHDGDYEFAYINAVEEATRLGFQPLLTFPDLRSRTARSARFEQAYCDARRAMDHRDTERAYSLLHMKAASPVTPEQRRRAYSLDAWVALARGDRDNARRKVRRLPRKSIDPLLQATVLEAYGENRRAIDHLQQARTAGDARPEVASALVRELLKAARYDEAGVVLKESRIPGGFKFHQAGLRRDVRMQRRLLPENVESG